MNPGKKCMFWLAVPAALFVSCMDGVEGEDTNPTAQVVFEEVDWESIGSTGAVIKSSYFAYGNDAVVEVGIMYAENDSSEFTNIPAAGISNKFSVALTGLQPSTSYVAKAYVKTGSGKIYSGTSTCSFTTAAAGTDPDPDPDPNPTVNQYQWGELPVMKEMDDVVYVTHYVTSNGQSDASAATKGRVRNYTLCYDESKLQPYWVAYPMHAWYDGGVGRNDSWRYDPYINTNAQPNLSSSYNGNYSRGHHVASSDRQKTVAMNKQTFYYSNMSPQIQNEFNGGIWNDLEKKVQDKWGFPCSDTLYVVTGSAFIGTLKTTKDKNDKIIPVPSHYYKVLLSSKTGKTGKPISQLSASELRCVGFWLNHFGYGTKDKISTAEMTTVADIEAKTGFTFFPMLSEDAKSVKNSYNTGDWPL